MGRWNSHEEKKYVDELVFSTESLFFSMGDHSGTHVDAPRHFSDTPNALTVDQMPLEKFYTPALCLDLSHKPLKSDISAQDLAAAEAASGATIEKGDTVLLHMAFNDRVALDSPAYFTDFPGLTKESAEWLGNKGVVSFGVEAVSPGRPGRNNYEVHHVCRDMEFVHMEGLINLEKLIGVGKFTFIGFPLKIRGGTGSPIRAVAALGIGACG